MKRRKIIIHPASSLEAALKKDRRKYWVWTLLMQPLSILCGLFLAHLLVMEPDNPWRVGFWLAAFLLALLVYWLLLAFFQKPGFFTWSRFVAFLIISIAVMGASFFLSFRLFLQP